MILLNISSQIMLPRKLSFQYNYNKLNIFCVTIFKRLFKYYRLRMFYRILLYIGNLITQYSQIIITSAFITARSSLG